MTSPSPSPPAQPVRILIVDDHPLVRAGFKALIGNEPNFQVCAEAAGFAEAIDAVRSCAPHLVIVDLSLACGSGLELIKHLHTRDPDIKLLVCSMHDESLFTERVLKAGARGYISKQEVTDHVVEAIHLVMAGGIYLSHNQTQRVLHNMVADRPGSVSDLSDRELEVFSLIGQGLGTAQIAEQLHLSIKTVETHRDKIKRKLSLSSASELARYAAQWALDHD